MNNSPQDQADSTTKQEKNNTKEKLPLTHVIVSVLAAAIGVQSKKNQEKDFSAKGSIVTYIVAGIIFLYSMHWECFIRIFNWWK